jgi:glycosyltransferase involved in cell wall biosynthesis
VSEPARWRINHWSPWGTDASGINNYSTHLVRALDEHLDITVIHPTEVDPELRSRRPRDLVTPTLDDADVDIYHVGNFLTFHHWMIGPLMRRGGIAVLHEWSIYDIFRPMFYRSWHLWEREMHYNGETNFELARYRADPGFLMAHPMNRRVFESADIVVVHTPWLREIAREKYPHADVRYIPHAGHVWPSQPITSNSPITVLGGIGRHKRVASAVEAFAQVAARVPDARLRIVGRGDDKAEIQRLRDLALELNIDSRIEWHLNVDRESYLRLLGESLLIVTLRSDTAGEMSGVLVEAWGAGRVAVTSDQPQFRHFDERFCRRVSLGDHGTSELAQIMSEALADPASFAVAGELARELICSEYSFERVARQYADLVDELAKKSEQRTTHGVNIYGSWGTPSGVAEGARRHARALVASGFPVTVPYGFRLADYDVRLVPREFSRLEKHPKFAVNLLMANINEFHEIPPSALGSPSAPHWNIGTWIYEFSEIPLVLQPRFKMVDEIWSLSQFATTTFRRYFDGPINQLPHIVDPRPQSSEVSLVRRQYGLRHDACVVMFSFDFSSGWARKNPLAVIAAFRDATQAEPDANAQLVMKVSGLTAQYRALLVSQLETVDGVLIDEHLSEAEMGDLFHAIDVYCSLHRAEGFGLGMAEAMALGKMVIGTNYSGNLDFMNAQNSRLVSFQPASMSEQDAAANPGLQRIAIIGSSWAQPEHDDAVAALRESFDPATQHALGERARVDIARHYSTSAATQMMRNRLEELSLTLQSQRTLWPRLT